MATAAECILFMFTNNLLEQYVFTISVQALMFVLCLFVRREPICSSDTHSFIHAGTLLLALLLVHAEGAAASRRCGVDGGQEKQQRVTCQRCGDAAVCACHLPSRLTLLFSDAHGHTHHEGQIEWCVHATCPLG